MTRLTVDLPDTLHKTLKTFSALDGKTMRQIAVSALEKYAVTRVSECNPSAEVCISKEKATSMLESFLQTYMRKAECGQVSDEVYLANLEYVSGYLTDEAEDKLLAPYLRNILDTQDLSAGKSWESLKIDTKSE